MRRSFLALAVAVGLVLTAHATTAATQPTAGQILSGWILAPTDSPNTLWYVWPRKRERLPVSTVGDIQAMLKMAGIKITSKDLIRIPEVGTTTDGDIEYRRKMAGRMLIVTDDHSRAWYVHPKTKRRARLGSGQAAVDFLRSQRMLVRQSTIDAIPIPPKIKTIIGDVVTSRGTFKVERLVINVADTSVRVKVDTGNDSDCGANCPVMSLGSYITRRKAVAGIHGTYFCPQDYAACAGKKNSYIYPVWNSFTKSWRNGGRIKFTAEPIVAFDTSNKPYLFPETRQFTSEADFANEFAVVSRTAGGSGVLQAALSNGPMLRRNGANALDSKKLDTKQATVHSARGGLGWKGDTFMVFIAHGATVTDLAAVAAALDLDNALNLDGGGSSALFADGRYIVGPGRNLPNAILLTHWVTP